MEVELNIVRKPATLIYLKDKQVPVTLQILPDESAARPYRVHTSRVVHYLSFALPKECVDRIQT